MNQRVITKLNTKQLAAIIPKPWRNQDMLISTTNDEVVIKKLESPDLWQIREKLKEVGKEVTPRDLRRAIAQVRAGKL